MPKKEKEMTEDQRRAMEREQNRERVKRHHAKLARINCRFYKDEYPAIEKAAQKEGKSVGKFVADSARARAGIPIPKKEHAE